MIEIEYCTKCRWLLRASWIAQELLSTFSVEIRGVTLIPVHEAMFVESNPIPVKWAVAEMGLMEHAIRLPLTELSAAYHLKVTRALEQADLLSGVQTVNSEFTG